MKGEFKEFEGKVVYEYSVIDDCGDVTKDFEEVERLRFEQDGMSVTIEQPMIYEIFLYNNLLKKGNKVVLNPNY